MHTEAYNFDFSSMIDEIPAKYNRSKHRVKDGNGIDLKWLELYQTYKNPKIPNNLITSLKQAIETNEWKSLGYFYTKRNKQSEFYNKFIDITAILFTYINTLSITWSQNDIDELDITNSLGLNPNNIVSPIELAIELFKEYNISDTLSITWSQNDIDYKALSITSILNEDYKIDKPFAEKITNVLLTPYTINGKQYQILYRIENPEFTETNKKARWKYAFDSFFYAKRIDYTLVNKNLENHYVRMQNKKIFNMGDYRILHTEFSNFLSLEIPTRDSFEDHVNALIGSKLKGCTITNETIRQKVKKDKTKKSKKYGVNIYVDGNKGFIYVEDLLSNADLYAYCGCNPTAFFGDDYFRHYTPYSLSNCVMRSMIRYNGELLDQCDVASMYPVILLQKYMNDFCDDDNEKQLINEVIHAENPRNIFMKWCDELNIEITKDEIKVENISYYNKRHASACKMKLHKMYESKLAGFCEWLAQMKTKTEAGHKGYWQHRFVSRWLEWQESMIMDRVLTKCWDNGIFACGVHDGIDVEHGKGGIVCEWIKQSMLENGYICTVTLNKE